MPLVRVDIIQGSPDQINALLDSIHRPRIATRLTQRASAATEFRSPDE
jgi:hypothetical protein